MDAGYIGTRGGVRGMDAEHIGTRGVREWMQGTLAPMAAILSGL